MKRLVLLGEGHGEVAALPILVRKLLKDHDTERLLFVDKDLIRTHDALGLVRWDKQTTQVDYTKWLRHVGIAARRGNVGGVLAVYDGDARTFPAGSLSPFCAASAARSMAVAAKNAGAGNIFSLAVVFACVEYESWIVAGAESLKGRSLEDGRLALPRGIEPPVGDPESHGKKWLEDHCPGYRPTRDQAPLTELLDLNVVRSKRLRSFSRLEHALQQILEALAKDSYIATPA